MKKSCLGGLVLAGIVVACSSDDEADAVTPVVVAPDASAEAGTIPDGDGAVRGDSIARCHPLRETSTTRATSQRVTTAPTSVVAWTPATLPAYAGPLALNADLEGAARFAEDILRRAEDVVFDPAGRLYAGTGDGIIYRANVGADGTPGTFERFAETGGHPLGLAFDPCGNLIVAVPMRGIVAVSPEGEVATLADRVNGTAIEYADELAVATDGTVYVTDASVKYARGWPYDFLEGRPHGRLLAYEPADGSVRVLAEQLYFPNGVVVAPDESYVLFAETWRGKVSKLWLTGASAGEIEPYAENLSVTPDNITLDDRGRLWMAGQRRTPQLDGLSASEQARLGMLQSVSDDAPLPPDPHTLVVVLDANGQVLRGLHADDGSLFPVSTAVPHGAFLYLGSNVGDGIARVALPPGL